MCLPMELYIVVSVWSISLFWEIIGNMLWIYPEMHPCRLTTKGCLL